MKKHIVIIGGVAGGATTAARLRRLSEDADITIVEKGDYVSFANCGLPYHLSGEIQKKESLLLNSPERFWERFRIRVLTKALATAIDPVAKAVHVQGPLGKSTIGYDELVLAQGAHPIIPNIEGAQSPHCFTLTTIQNIDDVLASIKANEPKKALVLGGGFIGIEAAEALRNLGLETTVVEFGKQILGPYDGELATLAHKVLIEQGIGILTQAEVVKIDPVQKTAQLKEGRIVGADLVLFAIGARPNTELAASAGVNIGASGAVSVDEFMATNLAHVWAVGDMVEIKNRLSGRFGRIALAGPANRQARVCATNIMGGHAAYKGGLGTSVIRIFDHSLASTGLKRETALGLGFRARTVTIHKDHHASYFPGATLLSFKLVFDEVDGTLLGAHAFGKSGVEKRIDVLATAIAGGLKIDDLIELDLAYAPMYNTANDPLQMAAMAAQNHIESLSPIIEAETFLRDQEATKEKVRIIDVRTKGEFEGGHLEGALNIALDDLRDKLDEIPKDLPIVVYCKVGYRGNLAARILLQNGFSRVTNMSGGYLSILNAQGVQA